MSEKVRLFGNLAPLVPDIEDMFEGPRSLEVFKRNGEEFLKIYRELCGLRPNEKMLDIGCGIGRKTLPLTQYFSKDAVYEGIDTRLEGVEWCCGRITPWFPNFHFQHIDVYNGYYNPNGKFKAAEFRFPFADESFSFVTLGSVFTHMLPDDIENYLSEIYRVLGKDGRCLITYFLLNEESLRLMGAGKSTVNFKHFFNGYRTISGDLPEHIIAFDEGWVRDLYRRLELKLVRLEYGSWCGRASYLSYQDLILAAKRKAA